MLVHLDLFSGIGGFALACEWAGIETIGFVEIDKYCQKVLRKHWSSVPIVEDIRDVEKIKEIVANATIKRLYHKENEQILEGTRGSQFLSEQSRIIDRGRGANGNVPTILITAGFPCQPFSVAGKQLSQGDDRYLWPETIAVIEAVKPKWVLLENVTGIINLALDTVLSDLEGAGYSTETLIIPACAVNAWHRRDRIWIVANNKCLGWETRAEQRIQSKEQVAEGQNTINIQPSIPNSTINSRRSIKESEQPQRNTGREATGNPCWWAVEPELGRVAHGIPNRVDRLKCLGNAIVPQAAYEIIKVIVEIENGIINKEGGKYAKV